MAKYMIQASYSAEAWAAQIKNPMNRMEVVGKQMAAMGCKLIDGYMTVPNKPGWGTDINEEVARAHPWDESKIMSVQSTGYKVI